MNAPTPPAATPTRARNRALAAVSVLLVAALGAAIVGAVLWTRASSAPAGWVNVDRTASGSTAEPTAQERQAFLLDAAQAAVDLTAVTPDDTDGMIAKIRRSSTSELAADLDDPAVRDALVQEVRDRGFTASPRVLAISPSSFDPASGTAQALVFVAQEVSQTGTSDKVLRRQGISLNMQLEDGVWRAAMLEQLFVGEGAPPGSPSQGSQAPADAAPAGSSPAPSAENPAGS